MSRLSTQADIRYFVLYPDSLRSRMDVDPKVKKYNGQTIGLRARAVVIK